MESKKFTVYTYHHPAEDGYRELILAYTTYQGESVRKDTLKTYEIEAINGYEAKKIAKKLRKQELLKMIEEL